MFMNGEIVIHRNGSLYEIICKALEEKTMEMVYVYKSVDKGDVIWTRPIKEMEDGRFTRYVR
jgi:hypothetical protein